MKKLKTIFAIVCALFVMAGTILPSQVFAYEGRHIVQRVIGIIWYNPDGTWITHGACVQTAETYDVNEVITFPELNVDELFNYQLEGWTKSKDVIPAATGSVNNPTSYETLELTSPTQMAPHSSVPMAPYEIKVEPTHPDSLESKTITRTVHHKFFDFNGNLLSTETETDSVVVDLYSTATFPAIPARLVDGFLPHSSGVAEVTVGIQDNDFTEEIHYTPNMVPPVDPDNPNGDDTPGQNEYTMTRTIVYNYWDEEGNLTSSRNEVQTVQIEQMDTIVTFPAKDVKKEDGYVADVEQIPSQEINAQDGDIEFVVNYHAYSLAEPDEPNNLEGWYQILCAGNQNFALDVNNATPYNKENIQIYQANSSAAQKFYLKDAGDGYYYLVTGTNNGNSVVDVTGAGKVNRTNIIQYSFHGGDNQKWKVIDNGDGTVSFVSKHSQKALDFAGGRYENFTNVLLWTYHGGINQRFVLVRQ